MVVMMGAWAAQITIHVNTPNGQTMTREYESGDSPSVIKSNIEDWSNGIFDDAYQHLFYNDEELDDSKQLFQLGFTGGNSYTLTMTYDYIPARQSNGTWTFTMPDADQLLEVEYNPVLTLRTNNSTMGTVALEPIEVPVNTAEFNDILSDWENDNNNLTEEEMPSDFVASTLAQASAWSSAPTSGWAYLIYDFNDNGTPKYVVFLDGEYRYNDAWNISHQTIYYQNYYYTTASVSPVVDNLDGTYNIVPGTTVTITAMAAERYHFVNWTDPNNNVIGTSTPIQVTVNSDTTIQGNFANNPLLTFGANDPAMGTVVLKPVSLPANAAEFSFPNEWNGDFNNLTANDLPSDFVPSTLEEARAWSSAPTTGYVTLIYGFNDVTGATKLVRFNDGVYSTNAETNFLHRDLNPIYGKFYYTIASIPPVVANNDGSYSVIPGTEVTVKATPNDGHYFVEWEDESTKTSHTVTVTRDTNLIATFNAYATLQIASNNEQMGTVALQNDLTSDELTVIKDVNAQSEWFPLNTRYLRYYPSTSQHIIPADSLAAMAGKVITGVKYYTENTNLPYEPPMDITVYLAEVDYTSFNNNLEDLNNCTEVYTGTLSATSVGDHGEMTITFSNPFTYGGSNLLVSMSNEIVGSAYNFDVVIDFRGKNSYNDSSSIFGIPQDNYIETSSFLPLCTFTYKEAIPNPDGGYWFIPGSEATVVATPATDRHFVNWTNEDPAVIDGGATKTFTVAGDTTLTANFAIDTVRLDSVRLTWQVQIGDADPISPTPYVTVNPTAADTMGYVLIPKNADVVITPSDGQKELVSKLDLIPIGAINGKFSVGSNKQVYFSKGNLQATTDNGWANWTFSFMEHQYSMVETADQNVGADYANQNVVSLFGRGTSGYNHGADYYQPNSTNKNPGYYYAYGDSQKSLFDESGKADWGYNAISNGGNTENSGWRTLTNKEWVWLLGPTYANSSPTPGTNCRTSSTISGTPNARFAKANLFGTTHGLIIFPDNYTHPEGVDAPTGINMKDATSWNANTYTSADWAKMEAAGAVFLPAAGRRPTNVGSSTDAYTVMYVGNTGCYWSSTDSTNDAQQVLFGSGDNFIVDGSAYRSDGHSVRLVKMATVSASAQTDPYVPARNSDNSWTFKMPTSDLMLRTAWKQDAGLAYAKADTTVYRGFTSTVQNPLTKPHSISESEVTYSITPNAGTTSSGNTINNGVVTIHGTGIDTVKARFAGNNDYLPDSAMYILRTLEESWKLTLVANGNGTVGIDGELPNGVIQDTATYTDGNKHYLVHPVLAGDINLVASPNPQNYLVSWTNALKGDVDSLKAAVTLISDTTVTANFAPYPTLTVTTTGSGSVSVASVIGEVETPQTADANTTNVYTLDPGTEVKLTATAATNYHFVSWEDNSTAAIRTLTMPSDGTENVEVTATFVGDAYLTIASNNTEYGNVAFVMASSEQKAHEKAVASTDYVPTPTGVDLYENCNNDNTKWYYDNDGIDASLGYMIYKSNGPEVSRVVFTLTNNETYTVTASTGSNTNAYFYYVYPKYNNVYSDANYTNLVCSSCGITKVELYVGNPSNPEGVEFVDATHAYVKPGKSVDVKATPNAAYYFVKWNDEEAINSNVAVTTSYTAPANGTYEAASLTANFAINTYTITATANDNNMGTVSGSGTYNEDAQVNLTATPNTGYHFVNWTKTGVVVSTTATYNFNATAETAGDYIANFAINTYTLTLATDPTNGLQGTLDVVRNNNNELPAGVTGTYPNYTVNEGVNVPLVIAPTTHYHLVSLIGGTNQPITYSDNHASIAVVKDTTITATFSIDTYVITAAANNSTLGTVSGGGTYNHGVTVTLTATATDSTHFVNWTKEGETNPVSTTATYNFTAEAAGNYTANFAINPTLKLVADGHGTVDTVGVIAGVTLKSAADKEYYVVPGTVVSVKAKPDAGFVFVQWNDGKTNNPLDTTINSEVTLTATFALPTPGLTPEGEVTVQGNRFVDEHGKIVGSPRLTEHGEFIDNGNSTSPVSLIGKFSVSSTKKVYFSPANLQYTRTSTSVDWSTGTWSFLAHQYSTVETAANPYCTENYGDKTVVGLFGWGTWGEGKTPNLTAYSNSNYTWSTDFSVPLGGYNDWRTLTKDEWIYLLSTRATGVTVNSTSDARYTLATINTDATEVKGMIIFPDGFAGSNTEDVTWGTINANSNYTTTCTSAGWNALEAANCLFLPAAGWRAINDNNDDCTRVGDINTWGYYWTSDASDNSTFSYTLKFYSQDVELDELALRRLGFPVRLVRDAE